MPRLQHDKFLKRGSTFSIEMDGESLVAVAGESIAAALTAAGKLSYRRDKTGAPRGLFCGMGACFECQVSVDGGPAQRACLTKARPGMKIRSLDYRVEIPASRSRPQATRRERLECDVLVVGAGPAGMSAATRMAEAGANVVVADERSEAGGQFYKQLASSYSFSHDGPPDSQYRDGASLIGKLAGTDTTVICEANVWGAFRDEAGNLEVCATAGARSYVVQPRQLVLATGAFESVPAFPGWTLPGVMTTGAAQSMVRAYRVAPGQRILIAGNGPLNLHLACELINGGVDVVAVAESAARPGPRQLPAAIGALCSSPGLVLRGVEYLQILRKNGVRLYYGHHILCADGDSRVRSGSISRLDRDARRHPNSEVQYEVDAICVGYALRPSNELARALGCKHEVIEPGLVAPVRDGNGQTSVAGVFVIGDCGVLGGAHVSMAEGRLAAEAILRNLSRDGAGAGRRDKKLLRRHRRFQRNLWSLYEAPDIDPASPDTPLCRCESVSLYTIRSLIASGVHDLGSLKRLSRAGMGACQGRYCQKQIATLLADMTANVPAAEQLFAPQVPVKPTLIAHLAAEKPEWRGYRTLDMPTTTTCRHVADSAPADTDVLIVGAGIFGIATALFLAREQVDVTIVDRSVPNGQASGGNAGSLHLQLLPFDYSEASGPVVTPAASALSLQKMGVSAWRELQQTIGADIELEITGGIMVAENDRDLELLRKKATLERSCGIEVEILSGAELKNLAPVISDNMIGATFCAGEGKVNPMLATPALLAEALNSGARLMENAEVIDIEYRHGKFLVKTSRGSISCYKVVNTAGAWTAVIASMIGVTLPVKTAPQQMIVTEPAAPAINHLIGFARRHLTMKQVANGNIIIGGGWSAGYDFEGNRAIALRESIEGNLWVAQRVVPGTGQLQMLRSWAALGVMIDGAPILGELPGHRGFFNAVAANGYTMGPSVGQITAELVRTGRRVADILPFSVERFD